MMYKSLLSLLLVASAVSVANAQTEKDLDNAILAKKDSIEAKRGLEIGGKVMGVLNNSYMSSDQDDGSLNILPNVERTQFVTADIDFHFRPYDALRANLTIRLEAGMQNYFASSTKGLSLPWMNVEGNIGKDFYWIVGDFRQQYSPLTLFAPTGLDGILYEPQIFARNRQMALDAAMIDGNQRNLQGVNLQYRHDFGDAMGELRAEAMFARLRRVQILDFSGANGNILPNGGNEITNCGTEGCGVIYQGSYQSSNMDKWLASMNLELLPMKRNIFVGVTGMLVADDSTSFTKTVRSANQPTTHDGVYVDRYGDRIMNLKSVNLNENYEIQPINPLEMDPQNTIIAAGRVGADVAGIMGNQNLTLDVMAEVAMSKDKVYDYAINEETLEVSKSERDEDGMAILATLNAGYKMANGLNVGFEGNFIKNDSSWYNNLAQSPQFFANRILNSDKDGNTVRFGVNSPLYSSFGSLYYFDPKFTPISSKMATTDDPTILGQTDSYNIAPYNKNSWGTSVYTRKELALISSMTDDAVQMILPNGLATSNRTGGKADVNVSFKDFAEVSALFTYMDQEKSNNPLLKEANYMEYGAGLKTDIGKMIGFSRPIEISGSYKQSKRTQELADEVKDMSADKGELNLDFINAGLYVQYLPRLGVSAGIQMINMEYDEVSSTYSKFAPGYEVPLVKGSQMQWMVGLDYTIADNVFLALNYGMISVENTYNTTSGVVGANMPNYAVLEENQTEYKHSFDQAVVQALLNVNF